MEFPSHWRTGVQKCFIKEEILTAQNVKMSVIWLTGLSGAGKSTIAEELTKHIDAQVVDGDVVRKTISSDLKHGKTDRIENYRRAIKCIKSKEIRGAMFRLLADP